MISCLLFEDFSDCSDKFQFHMDFTNLCYQAKIDLGGLGGNRALTMGFYFDSSQKFGICSSNPGLLDSELM